MLTIQHTHEDPPALADGHTGRPVVCRTGYGRILVLCPAGHLIQSMAATDWSGSRTEANCGDSSYTVTCHGTMKEGIK